MKNARGTLNRTAKWTLARLTVNMVSWALRNLGKIPLKVQKQTKLINVKYSSEMIYDYIIDRFFRHIQESNLCKGV